MMIPQPRTSKAGPQQLRLETIDLEGGYLSNESEVVALCVALGAAEVGGPISSAERRLVKTARGTVPSEDLVDKARDAILQGDDPLGDAFCELRSPHQRRSNGAFYTGERIVRVMVDSILAEHPDRLVDAGCGSGRFLAGAYRAGFRGQLVGVDVDPLATLMTRAHLAVLGATKVFIVNRSYLHFDLPVIDGKTGFIGNPPYVRHHGLGRKIKEWAKWAAKRLGLAISGLAGLHALFVIATALKSNRGDVGCFITSAEWLDVGYGKVLRRLFSDRLGCRRLDLLDPKAVAFEDAMSTAVIVSWTDGYEGSTYVRMIRDVESLKNLSGGMLVSRRRLAATERWSCLATRRTSGRDGRVPLGDLAEVHRGVVTGRNGYFIMSREEAADRGISEYTTPCLVRAHEVFRAKGIVHVEDVSSVLLDVPADISTNASSSLRDYLAHGERMGVPEGYICSHRAAWWNVGGSPPPAIVATYMARRPPGFALNPDDVQIVNVFMGIHPRESVSPSVLQGLVYWLNEHAEQITGGRTYHGGLRKFEPSELKSVLVPPLKHFA